jgi:hypothetical protein
VPHRIEGHQIVDPSVDIEAMVGEPPHQRLREGNDISDLEAGVSSCPDLGLCLETRCSRRRLYEQSVHTSLRLVSSRCLSLTARALELVCQGGRLTFRFGQLKA